MPNIILLGKLEKPVWDGSEGSLQSWGAKRWRKWKQQKAREELWKVNGVWCQPGSVLMVPLVWEKEARGGHTRQYVRT